MTATIHPDHPALNHVILTSDPAHAVARVVLRLTAYLASPNDWASGGAAALLEAYLKVHASGGNWWLTTSMLPDWTCLGPDSVHEVLAQLSSGWKRGVRHGFHFQLAKNVNATHTGFRYREVDERRPRAGVIEMILPATRAPDDLFELARLAAAQAPLYSMVGGYGIDWSTVHPSTAFLWSYRWCKRYIGLDIQSPARTSLDAPAGLPGSNWLTYVGERLAAARGFSLDRLASRTWSNGGLASLPIGKGILVRAGDAPTLGDNNRFDFPDAYAEAAEALSGVYSDPARELPGLFRLHSVTNAYVRRFLDPKSWDEAPLDEEAKTL